MQLEQVETPQARHQASDECALTFSSVNSKELMMLPFIQDRFGKDLWRRYSSRRVPHMGTIMTSSELLPDFVASDISIKMIKYAYMYIEVVMKRKVI